jgi:hypothetical protein
VNVRRLALASVGVIAVVVGLRLALIRAASTSLLSMLTTRPVAIVATDCSVTPNVRRFAEERSIVVVPTDYGTELGRTLCNAVIRDLGMRERVVVLLLGRRSACESLTAEARTLADGHDSPTFIGPDGEDEAMKRAFREFQLQERLKFLRE